MQTEGTVSYLASDRVFEQYFTKPNIGDLLVDQLTLPDATHIIELGAGTGSLLASARRRWGTARLTSVDIDPSLQMDGVAQCGHRHIVLDVLSPNFRRSRRFEIETFDAAVCNPPYRNTAWTSSYRTLLKSVGLKAALPIMECAVQADLIFLAHNLRLLRAGGQVGIIVPDGTVTGERSRPLREALLTEHALHSVIELPERAFAGTDAKTYILTLEKCGRTPHFIPLYRADDAMELSTPILITPDEAGVRMDHRYYAWQRGVRRTHAIRLGDITGVEIIRGRWGASAARDAGLHLLHSTDVSDQSKNHLWHLSREPVSAVFGDAPRARRGDIVITRVGRRLEDKLARVGSGEAVISDCLYVVRGPTAVLKQLWRSLKSQNGQAWLRAHARGVCAKVLNRSSLLDYPLSMESRYD